MNIALKDYVRHLFYNGAKSVQLTIKVDEDCYEYKVVHTYKDFKWQWDFATYIGYEVVDADVLE